jgi:hypothetical protein
MRSLVAIMIAIGVVGCQKSGPPKFLVTGEVTCNGELVPEGHISLVPLDGTLVPDAAAFKNGTFSLMAREGQKRVEIFATRVVVAAQPGRMGEQRQQYIPSRYNHLSELKTEVMPIDENRVDFHLQGAAEEPVVSIETGKRIK